MTRAKKWTPVAHDPAAWDGKAPKPKPATAAEKRKAAAKSREQAMDAVIEAARHRRRARVPGSRRDRQDKKRQG